VSDANGESKMNMFKRSVWVSVWMLVRSVAERYLGTKAHG